jgi:enoyl-CoA hydratase/carnithine racemase
MPIPTIAMIRGYCIGGGTAAAVCCDLRICTENARFGVPAAKLGLGYGLNRAQPLVDLVGPAFAKEMFFTGRQFTAREAERMGLVNRVIEDDKLEAAVDEMARTIAENAPLTVKCAKLVVGEAIKDSSLRDVAATERAVQACFDSNDYKEGQAAFMEKRKPNFTGS